MNEIALAVQNVAVAYGEKPVVTDVNMEFPAHQITALIGASGSGKSTLLRSLNRMNDEIATVTGQINFHGVDINRPETNVYRVRQQIGMVFQQPTPFPMSIYENVIYGLRLRGEKDRTVLDQRVEASLKQAALWEEVKDRLQTSAQALSGGQQQRLCIARTLATQPEIILMDEPTSALDPISTNQIEATLAQLKEQFTIIIVTHNMQQASRISDWTAYFEQGKLVEFKPTDQLFMNPSEQRTADYLSGKFG
ncbi:phosphate ABC transporter ATP-binding protein PstB [Limosilactobacillus ingluviei]|uniref:Phosphate abc transporter, atp-binding protein n=1 Tax=Limosilactobacillus ingluviei DSM 15946 TaxID=1423760 RepID=A0A0R1UD15_9LACO|nr:phosphate ABC transporter ATP-binding protein PstB [Limosilactobacillus ingluviei]KRL91293.1 phosphate abc transporter, atp-binding protein [Limosilactobacillus ingluviei DSM 15946]MBM6728368.1 phosphate ABC transporter ATP-binding protein [Limosilactobacillus ingluviei]MDO4604020.1 phosphate ABC transporter ATP-binding protein PstB [Limosilactobacillus ingluviei]